MFYSGLPHANTVHSCYAQPLTMFIILRSDYRCTYHLSALCEVTLVHIGHYSSSTPGTSSTGVGRVRRTLGLYCTLQDQQDC